MNLTRYELIRIHVEEAGFKVDEDILAEDSGGIIFGRSIIIDKFLNYKEKYIILLHEWIHYIVSPRKNMMNQNDPNNRREEKKVNSLIYKHFLPLEKIHSAAVKYNCNNTYELAEALEVPEEFLLPCLKHYVQKYGNIVFNPEREEQVMAC